MKIHVTGRTQGANHELNIHISGGELDIINLIDDLAWAAQTSPRASADRLYALRKAITDTVGLVAD